MRGRPPRSARHAERARIRASMLGVSRGRGCGWSPNTRAGPQITRRAENVRELAGSEKVPAHLFGDRLERLGADAAARVRAEDHALAVVEEAMTGEPPLGVDLVARHDVPVHV